MIIMEYVNKARDNDLDPGEGECSWKTSFINALIIDTHTITESPRFTNVYSSDILVMSPGSPLSWRRHEMETFFALLALCAGNSLVTGEFPSKGQWRGALVLSLICALNKRLSKQSLGWWFETPSRSLWRHCNDHGNPKIVPSNRVFFQSCELLLTLCFVHGLCRRWCIC